MLRRAAAAVAALAVAAAAVTGAGCHEDYPTCYAGEYRACECGGGATGYAQCLASEDGYAPCVCDGRTPASDASPFGTGAAPGSRQYMESCTSDTECVTHVCGSFPSRGNKCTKACTSSADCPPPSPGCNPQAICKSP
jgi:hypothetical protein